MQIPHPVFARCDGGGASYMMLHQTKMPEELENKHAETQQALERVRDVAEGWFGLTEAERNKLRGNSSTRPL